MGGGRVSFACSVRSFHSEAVMSIWWTCMRDVCSANGRCIPFTVLYVTCGYFLQWCEIDCVKSRLVNR